MSNDEIKPRVRSYQATKPTPVNDGESLPIRGTPYGEQYVRPLPGERYVFADEGSYFVAHNAINDAATTLAGHVAPVLADADATLVKPFVFFRVPTGVTKKVRLDYIEMDVTVIGASGTSDNYAWQLDSGASRYSSGGSALTIVNPNMDSAETSVMSATNHLLAGDVVASVETANVRHGGHGQLRAAIMVVGDRYTFKFGGDPNPGANVVATAASRHIITMPPIVLGAEDSFLLAMYAPSQAVTAAVYKLRLAWWER